MNTDDRIRRARDRAHDRGGPQVDLGPVGLGALEEGRRAESLCGEQGGKRRDGDDGSLEESEGHELEGAHIRRGRPWNPPGWVDRALPLQTG